MMQKMMQEMMQKQVETSPLEKALAKLVFLKSRKLSLCNEGHYDGKYDAEIKRLEELTKESRDKNELATVQTKRSKEA